MATSKDTDAYLTDAALRHTVYVNRFAGGQLKEMIPYLQRVRRNIAAELSSTDLTKASRKRLQNLYQEITGITAASMQKMGKKLKTNMVEFAKYEQDFSARMLTAGTKVDWDVPHPSQVASAILSKPLLVLEEKGISFDEVIEQFSESKARQLIGTIQDGVITGKSNEAILASLANVANVSMAAGLKTLVITVTNQVSNTAREELYKENADVTEGVEWLATLDSATCLQCGSLDGKQFGINEGPRPQIHPRCHCTTKPVVKTRYSIKGAIEGLERPARGPGNKPQHGISADQKYPEWLKDQPAYFQDSILGKTRGALFREGKLDFNRFVDEQFRPITIKELKESDARAVKTAFKKSGLLDDEE